MALTLTPTPDLPRSSGTAPVPLPCYEALLTDGSVELVHGASAYQQEGQMTTFFATGDEPIVDAWSRRLTSIRTTDIKMIRWLTCDPVAEAEAITRSL